jgi:hypothetical protein
VWNFHSILALVGVQQQIEAAGSHTRQLTHNDVLGDASHRIHLGMTRSIHQHVDSLLERASHERASVLSIDTVTCDGHQVTFGGHHVAQQRQVTVVDVQSVELQHGVHLLLHRFTHSFDAQHAEDFANVVAERSNGIHVALAENFDHGGAVGFQQPLADALEFTRLSDDDSLLGVGLRELKDCERKVQETGSKVKRSRRQLTCM